MIRNEFIYSVESAEKFPSYNEDGLVDRLINVDLFNAIVMLATSDYCDFCNKEFENIYDIFVIMTSNKEYIYSCPNCSGITSSKNPATKEDLFTTF